MAPSTPLRTVYPRVGGGNRGFRIAEIKAEGLSPRGRGKPGFFAGLGSRRGSIPAWAGETVGFRVVSKKEGGLSPRGRGKRRR